MERLTYFDGGKWRLKIGDTEYSGEAVDRPRSLRGHGAGAGGNPLCRGYGKIACALHELNAYKELGSIDCLRKLAGGPGETSTITNGGKIRAMDDDRLAQEILRRWRAEMEAGKFEDISTRWCDMKGGCVSSKGYPRPCIGRSSAGLHQTMAPAASGGGHLMDYEKLVAELRDWLPPESEKIPYGELVGAPYPYNLQGPLVYADEVCNLVEEAADAITALLDENALKNRKSMWRKLLEAVKSAFGWGTKERRTLMDIEKLRKSLLENSDPDGPCIEG